MIPLRKQSSFHAVRPATAGSWGGADELNLLATIAVFSGTDGGVAVLLPGRLTRILLEKVLHGGSESVSALSCCRIWTV